MEKRRSACIFAVSAVMVFLTHEGVSLAQPLASSVLLQTGQVVDGGNVFEVRVPAISPNGAIAMPTNTMLAWRPTSQSPTRMLTTPFTMIPDGSFRGSWTAVFDSSNRVVGGDSNAQGVGRVMFGAMGSVGIAANRNTPAPGLSNQLFTSFGHPVASDDGQIYFVGTINSSSYTGLWMSNAGAAPTLLFGGSRFASSSPTPGLPGRVLEAVNQDVRINPSGTVVWQGWSSTGVGSRGTVFVGSGSTFEPVLTAGDVLAGWHVSAPYSPRINSAGEMTMCATLYPTSTLTGGSFSSIVRRTADGQMSLVARGGTSGPGMSAGEVWGSSSLGSDIGPAIITNAGDIVFAGQVRQGGTNDRGIWRAAPDGQISFIARNGTPITSNAGLQVLNIDNVNMVANARGDVIFASEISGSGVSMANDRGLFVHNPDFGLLMIAREGDIVQIAPGVTRTIASLSFTSNTFEQIGMATSLNDSRQFVYQVTFTNGDSAAMYAVVPTPGTAAALSLWGLTAVRRRRRKVT